MPFQRFSFISSDSEVLRLGQQLFETVVLATILMRLVGHLGSRGPYMYPKG
jgi:hypothetical protein